MSSAAERDRPAEVLAGFLASAAIFVGLAAIAYRPVRLAPFAIVLALGASVIGGRHDRLAAAAVVASTTGFALGLMVAVLTENPLW